MVSEEELSDILGDYITELETILSKMRKKRKNNTQFDEAERNTLNQMYNKLKELKQNIYSFINKDTKQTKLF